MQILIILVSVALGINLINIAFCLYLIMKPVKVVEKVTEWYEEKQNKKKKAKAGFHPFKEPKKEGEYYVNE